MAVHLFLGGGLEEVGGSLRRIGCERTAGLVCLLALEQRVPLKLGLDEGGKLDIGELQQLDRLLQLRRHHQAVALPKLKLCGERHTYSGRAVESRPKS